MQQHSGLTGVCLAHVQVDQQGSCFRSRVVTAPMTCFRSRVVTAPMTRRVTAGPDVAGHCYGNMTQLDTVLET